MMLPSVTQLFALLLPCLPLAVAAALYVRPLQARACRLSAWIPLSGLALLFLYGEVVEFPWLLLGARVGVDDLAAPLLILASLAWTLAGLHARSRIPDKDQPRFFLFWLLTWTGNLCVFITLDAASFYAAYAMMSVSAYGLIIFYRRPDDYRAGRIYLAMALLGEAFILAGLFLLGSSMGNIAFDQQPDAIAQLQQPLLVAGLFAAGFAVKMGMVPLHMWLPLAHPQAPVPASAVLSGVILKAGLMGCIRFLPFEVDGFALLGASLLAIGLVSAFFGVVIGLTQTRMKTVLAYSSISQMGLISAGIGAALMDPAIAPALLAAVTLFALHHGLAKTALFLSVDMATERPVLARRLVWLPAIALAGAPLSSGALAKVNLKSHWPDFLTGLEPLLLISSVATTLLLTRFLVLLWQSGNEAASDRDGVPAAIPWLLLLLAGLTVPWVATHGFAGLAPLSTTAPFRPDYLLETLLPVVAGLMLATAAWRLNGERWRPNIPPGDLINIRLSWSRAPGLLPGFGSLKDGLSPLLETWERMMGHSEQALSRMATSLLVLMSGLGLLLLAVTL
ncbi:complex I subunit 5 family protein [Natronospira bacteriovora]|uniref:Complex I subunit 5 family protein n=1 Tax=Natronospira bacteriovora TaxID=3069753 RepID=A0ABU0W9W4_9GAMM|nr:complex I subunit 5 family protein [Natronospira sp. AB-CW4]MDQ2070694.1 complex I subunit 5 family protein [Natronospira sp. AB-CW4]